MQKQYIILFLFFIFLSLESCKADPKIESDKNIRLETKADTVAVYCKKNGLDTTFCILIDMSIYSGKNRLFVWDLKKDSIMFSGLCCHGAGGKSTALKPEFSNVPGSNCTSLGKYKTGARSYSQWGIHVHYKLHGLEKTNNNAFERIVVLHSHSPVPNKEIHPFLLPMGYSLGCPVVSDEVMTKLDKLLKEAKKPVLLWIYQ